MLKYEQIDPVSREEAEANFVSGDIELIARTLIAIGLHDEDWKWVEQQGLCFLLHEHEVVVSAAILSLAYTARVNGIIDKERVTSALQKLAHDSRYAGRVQDALDDIERGIDR